MTSQYKNNKSVAKNPTISLDVDDPRVSWDNLKQTQSRIGSEIEIIGSEGRQVLFGGDFGPIKGDKNIVVPTDPVIPKVPGGITNLSAEWQELASGPALVFSFDIDLNITENTTVNSFEYTLSDGTSITPRIYSTKLNTESDTQEVIFYYADNTKYFGIFQTTFDEFVVRAIDKSGEVGAEGILTDIPVYVADLCTPIITVSSIPMGYSVTLTDICTKPYEFLSVEEIVSDAGSAPTTGYQQVYLNKITPANILTPTTAARWVKARYTSGSGLYGPYSNAVKVIPTNPISADLIPPSEVTAVSASWSGDNIVVSYTLPSTDAGARFKIALTAPNSSVGYFYFFPTTGTLNQTGTISKDDIFLQFGYHYSSYSGLIKSIDPSDNHSDGVAFTVPVRSCTLTSVIPTFSTTALVNGYSVSYTLPTSAVYAEVYQKYTSWSGVTPIDSFTGAYASGGASGSNTVTLSSVVSNKGITVSPLVGYRVIGSGIPNNSYITAVSGSQITINNNFTSQVSGSVTGYAVVYSGTSPANISSTIYANTYLLVRYYDDFDCASSYSSEQIVVPLQPVTVDVTGPGNVATVTTPTSGVDLSGTLGFNAFVNLSWTAVSDTTLRGYRIRFRPYKEEAPFENYSYADSPGTDTTYRLGGLAIGATYEIAIATYDEYNNTSSEYKDFANVTIPGTPAMSNYITAGNAGFQFGSGIKDKAGTQNATAQGLYLNNSNYWYLTAADAAQFKVGGSTENYLSWDGDELAIDGNITAKGGSFAGNIALTTSGASIYSGDVITVPNNLTGDGFIFNKDGILIRKGTNQVSLDTTNGAITANKGEIASWEISESKIEKQNPANQKYAGLSPSGTYSFWSGSTLAGGDATEFAVDNTGKMFANNVSISGGDIDVGGASTVYTNGSGVSGATSITVTSSTGISTGRLVFGTGIASGTVVTSVTGTTIGLNKATTGTVSGLIRFVASSGVHITRSGDLYAIGGNFNGNITAKSGTIEGNLQVISGTFYTGTSPTSTSVLINDKGLASIDASNVTLTAMLNTPISSGNIPLGNGQTSVGTLPNAISFFTQAALIGGWVVDSTKIKDRSEQFVLDSSGKTLSITGVIDQSTNFRVELGTGVNVFSAGVVGQTASTSITRAGLLTANNATIRGTIKAQLGGFGYYNPTTEALVNGWNVTGDTSSASITAQGTALINLASGGKIRVGSYDIESNGTAFTIKNTSSQQNILTTDTNASGISRIYLGQEGRQVELAKNAEISGDYNASAQDYRSGGLRNMYTIVQTQYVSTVFPAAASGSVLLVYDPNSA